ncbi:hypothetical protein PHJA_002813200 [Phtheirospermum japonicum]|uniref:Ubiquitin-like domain-containing protein n=1 Tax=Phtheirospermum japonicum TaxID=374723 RepID=A0A830DL92_9LAMI|nr:hypothetical protein PHJA_002813200 [Phtheirospermum japonicum]
MVAMTTKVTAVGVAMVPTTKVAVAGTAAAPPSRPKSPDDQTAMYIRVKRSKSTYFLQCVPSETVLQIKEKLQELIDQPVNDQRLILMPNQEVLDDSKSLADQKVENDAIVALTLRKDDSEFEEVNIVRADDFYQSHEADGGVDLCVSNMNTGFSVSDELS